MNEDHHTLLIPVEGLFEFRHEEAEPNVESILAARGDEGRLVTLNLPIEGARLHFLAHPEAQVNRRAREALAMLTDVHMILTGPAVFTGLSLEESMAVIRELS